MRYHLGRLIDHVHLRVSDLEASKRFYRAILEALDLYSVIEEGPDYLSADELWIDKAESTVSRVHLAFQAGSRDAVHKFHAAALAAGGRDNGAPGKRPYGAAYYAAYALDPDGNNIEAVYHGPITRSVQSVVVTTLETGPNTNAG